ncbi:MAG: hypothetical protein DMF64_20195 [Acidobacteria bacterium]|nr:MAG: hypothetical protein DMF64_20195 [Acidobacteriota bacterium]
MSAIAAQARPVSADQVDALNIGLMLMACALAFVMPFELFLFAYVVLGPLHYLTEISWLHRRNYFVRGRYDYLWLVGLCAAVVGLSLTHSALIWRPVLVWLAFGCALALVLFATRRAQVLFLAGALVVGWLCRHLSSYQVLFSLFLPTIIHVYLFTGAFILYGALKRRSLWGYASLLVFILCGALCFLPVAGGASANAWVQQTYESFAVLNYDLARVFRFADIRAVNDIYTAQSGLWLMRAIAFAYTYHYLNWFSKTSIIKWHRVSRRQLIGILALWLLSIGLYLYDYRTGLLALLFLSLLHVFLEFPLNYRTLAGIGRELRHGLARPARLTGAA